MNQPAKVFSLLILFTLVCVPLSYAAPKTTTIQDKDKYGYVPPATTGTPTKIQTSTTTPLPKVYGVAKPLDPLEVTPTPPQTVDITPYRPVCSGYDPNDHREIILAHGGACPPGYKCNYVDNTNHNLFNCKLAVAPGTPIYADNAELCRWDTGCGNL